MISQPYLTDLSNQEWAILAPLLPPAKPGGRPRSVELRRILDGIFYVLRSGCQWRLLPREFPPWSTVYDYFEIMAERRASGSGSIRPCVSRFGGSWDGNRPRAPPLLIVSR